MASVRPRSGVKSKAEPIARSTRRPFSVAPSTGVSRTTVPSEKTGVPTADGQKRTFIQKVFLHNRHNALNNSSKNNGETAAPSVVPTPPKIKSPQSIAPIGQKAMGSALTPGSFRGTGLLTATRQIAKSQQMPCPTPLPATAVQNKTVYRATQRETKTSDQAKRKECTTTKVRPFSAIARVLPRSRGARKRPSTAGSNVVGNSHENNTTRKASTVRIPTPKQIKRGGFEAMTAPTSQNNAVVNIALAKMRSRTPVQRQEKSSSDKGDASSDVISRTPTCNSRTISRIARPKQTFVRVSQNNTAHDLKEPENESWDIENKLQKMIEKDIYEASADIMVATRKSQQQERCSEYKEKSQGQQQNFLCPQQCDEKYQQQKLVDRYLSSEESNEREDPQRKNNQNYATNYSNNTQQYHQSMQENCAENVSAHSMASQKENIDTDSGVQYQNRCQQSSNGSSLPKSRDSNSLIGRDNSADKANMRITQDAIFQRLDRQTFPPNIQDRILSKIPTDNISKVGDQMRSDNAGTIQQRSQQVPCRNANPPIISNPGGLNETRKEFLLKGYVDTSGANPFNARMLASNKIESGKAIYPEANRTENFGAVNKPYSTNPSKKDTIKPLCSPQPKNVQKTPQGVTSYHQNGRPLPPRRHGGISAPRNLIPQMQQCRNAINMVTNRPISQGVPIKPTRIAQRIPVLKEFNPNGFIDPRYQGEVLACIPEDGSGEIAANEPQRPKTRRRPTRNWRSQYSLANGFGDKYKTGIPRYEKFINRPDLAGKPTEINNIDQQYDPYNNGQFAIPTKYDSVPMSNYQLEFYSPRSFGNHIIQRPYTQPHYEDFDFVDESIHYVSNNMPDIVDPQVSVMYTALQSNCVQSTVQRPRPVTRNSPVRGYRLAARGTTSNLGSPASAASPGCSTGSPGCSTGSPVSPVSPGASPSRLPQRRPACAMLPGISNMVPRNDLMGSCNSKELDVDLDIVQQMVAEENEDVDNTIYLIDMPTNCSPSSFSVKQKLRSLRKKSRSVKILEESLEQNLPHDDDGTEVEADLVATLMHHEETGKAIKSPPRSKRSYYRVVESDKFPEEDDSNMSGIRCFRIKRKQSPISARNKSSQDIDKEPRKSQSCIRNVARKLSCKHEGRISPEKPSGTSSTERNQSPHRSSNKSYAEQSNNSEKTTPVSSQRNDFGTTPRPKTRMGTRPQTSFAHLEYTASPVSRRNNQIPNIILNDEIFNESRKDAKIALATPISHSPIAPIRVTPQNSTDPKYDLEAEFPPWGDSELESTQMSQFVDGSPYLKSKQSKESIVSVDGIEYIPETENPKHYSRVQLRGSTFPNWFPGYFCSFPETRDTVKIEKRPSVVFKIAWNTFKPNDVLQNSEIIIV